MRLNITGTWIRATALHDVARQVDIAVQRQIGPNLTYIPVLSDANNAIVLSDFKGLDEVDTDWHHWANGQIQNVRNGTVTGKTPQGVIIEDPAGNQLPFPCRGRDVNEQVMDCARKVEMYVIDPVAQHANGTALSRREEGKSDIASILTYVLGGTTVVGSGIGLGLHKVYASKKKARKAAAEGAAATVESTGTKGEYSLEVTLRQGDRAPSPLAIESEVSLDAVIIKRAAESDGSSASSAISFEDSLTIAESGVSTFEEMSMSSITPPESASNMQENIGERLLQRGVEHGLEAGRNIDATVLEPLANQLRQTRPEMEADPRIGSFTSVQPGQHEEVRKNRFEREPRVKVAEKVRVPQQPVAKPEGAPIVDLPPPKVVTPVLEPANGVYEAFPETRPEQGWTSPYLDSSPVMDASSSDAQIAELMSQAQAAEMSSEQTASLEAADTQRVTEAQDTLTRLRSDSAPAEQIAVGESNLEMAEQQRNLDMQRQRSSQKSAEDLYAQGEVLQVQRLDASNAEVTHLERQASGAEGVTNVESVKTKLKEAAARSKTNADAANRLRKAKELAATKRKGLDERATQEVAAQAGEVAVKAPPSGTGIEDILNGAPVPGDPTPQEQPHPDPVPSPVDDVQRVEDMYLDPNAGLPPVPEPGPPGGDHRDPHRPGGTEGEGGHRDPTHPEPRPPHLELHPIAHPHPPRMRRVRRGHLQG